MVYSEMQWSIQESLCLFSNCNHLLIKCVNVILQCQQTYWTVLDRYEFGYYSSGIVNGANILCIKQTHVDSTVTSRFDR